MDTMLTDPEVQDSAERVRVARQAIQSEVVALIATVDRGDFVGGANVLNTLRALVIASETAVFDFRAALSLNRFQINNTNNEVAQ